MSERVRTGWCWWSVAAAASIGLGASATIFDDGTGYRAGIGLLNKGMHDLAAKELRAYLSGHPDASEAPSARYALAVCLFRLGQHDEAAKELDQVVDRKGFEFAADARLLRAQCSIAAGDDASAGRVLESLLKDRPDFAQADRVTALLGEVLYRRGDFKRAAVVLGSVGERWPGGVVSERAEYICTLAEAAGGETRAAADRGDRLLARSPEGVYAANAALVCAQCRHRLGELEAADRMYERAARSGDVAIQGDAMLGRAQVARAAGRAADAQALVDAVLTGATSEGVRAGAMLERGRLLYDKGQYDTALQAFERVATGCPPGLADDAAYWSARCELAMGRSVLAAEHLEAAAERFPQSELAADMMFDRAEALTRSGNEDRALLAWEQWRERFGGNGLAAEAMLAQAGCLHRLGKYAQSLALCEEVEKARLASGLAVRVDLLIAENRYLSENFARAEAAYRVFGERHPEDRSVWRAGVRRGLCLLKLGRGDEGAIALAKLLEDRKEPDGGGEREPALFASGRSALGTYCFEKGDWAGAERWFGAMVGGGAAGASDADTLLRYGLSIERQGRFGDAVPILERGVKAGAGREPGTHARFELGQCLVELGKLDEASRAFEGVVSEERDAGRAVLTAHALRHLASIASKSGRAEDAAAILGRVAGAPGNTDAAAELAVQQAAAWLAAGRYEEAERVCTTFLGSHEEHARAGELHARRAVATNRLGRHAEALEELDGLGPTAGALSPDTAAMVRYERGLILRSLGRDAESGAAYRALLAGAAPPVLGAYGALDLAQIELQAERVTEALTLLDQCRGSAGKLSGGEADRVLERETYVRATCLLKLGKAGEAAALLEGFADRYPKSEILGSVRLVLGEALLRAGRAEQAAREFELAWGDGSSKEHAAPALLKLGEARSEAGQWARSDEAYTAFLDRFPDDEMWFRARFGQGWAREQQGRHDGAIEAYRDVVARHQGATAARAQFQIGECRYAQKRLDEAVTELLKVDVLYAYPEWSAAAVYEAGRCLKELGRRADAGRQFDDVVKRFPDSSWAKLAQEQGETVRPAALPGRSAGAAGLK